MKHLSWYSSPTGTLMGYGYASLCMIEALQRQEIRVDFLSETAPAHLNFIQPEWYQFPGKKQHVVGYTPWESSVVPDSWKGYIDRLDDFWTTSSYCQEIYKKYDLESKVLPHGIDPETYFISERTLNDQFVFYHAGSPTERKGSQLVVDAFLDLFDGNSDVVLLLKSTGPTNARWTDKKGFYRGGAGHHPQIHVVEFDLTVEDMAKLYHRAHCFVYPSSGEGFGLIPFQALATGVPTIVTNATGMKDFAHYGLPLNSTEEEGHGIHLGTWAKPDPVHLRELMKQVFDNWKEENKRSVQNARIIHNTQTWDHVAKQTLEMIGDKIGY